MRVQTVSDGKYVCVCKRAGERERWRLNGKRNKNGEKNLINASFEGNTCFNKVKTYVMREVYDIDVRCSSVFVRLAECVLFIYFYGGKFVSSSMSSSVTGNESNGRK